MKEEKVSDTNQDENWPLLWMQGKFELIPTSKTRHIPMNGNMNVFGCSRRISIFTCKSCPHGGSIQYEFLEVFYFLFLMIGHKVDASVHVLKKKRAK